MNARAPSLDAHLQPRPLIFSFAIKKAAVGQLTEDCLTDIENEISICSNLNHHCLEHFRE